METNCKVQVRIKGHWSPHSLGKLIEWKQVFGKDTIGLPLTPHSLGKLIEWKLRRLFTDWETLYRRNPPLEDWKLIE